MIHVAITRRVRPGRESEFEVALRTFFRESLADPHTTGAALIQPAPETGSNEYGILRSFPDEDARRAFYESEAYRRWNEAVAPLVEGTADKQQLHGLEAFFRGQAQAPPTWKMAIVTWLGVNPAVYIWAQSVPKVIPGLPPLVELLVVNALVVVTLSWVFMPLLVRLLGRFLGNNPSP